MMILQLFVMMVVQLFVMMVVQLFVMMVVQLFVTTILPLTLVTNIAALCTIHRLTDTLIDKRVLAQVYFCAIYVMLLVYKCVYV